MSPSPGFRLSLAGVKYVADPAAATLYREMKDDARRPHGPQSPRDGAALRAAEMKRRRKARARVEPNA